MTIQQLNEIREKAFLSVASRKVGQQKSLYRHQVLVCGGSGCTSGNSRKIYDEFAKEIAEKGLAEDVNLVMTGCFGLCALGPVVIVYPEGSFYAKVELSHVCEIVDIKL